MTDASWSDSAGSLETAVIEEGTKNIVENAFSGFKKLRSVTLGSGLRNIGESAFSGCTGLRTVVIPVSVTGIGKNAFYNCWFIEDVYYAGTQAQWKQITVDSGNEPLISSNIHFGEQPPAEPGDGNGDGRVDRADLAVIVLYVTGGDATAPKAADMNGDGSVDHSDVAALLQVIADELTVSDAAMLARNGCPAESAAVLRLAVGLPNGLW